MSLSSISQGHAGLLKCTLFGTIKIFTYLHILTPSIWTKSNVQGMVEFRCIYERSDVIVKTRPFEL